MSMHCKKVSLLIGIVLFCVELFAQNPFQSVTDQNQIRDQLIGYGVKAINVNTYSPPSVGKVVNLNEPSIPFNHGVFLSTGDPANYSIVGSNNSLRNAGQYPNLGAPTTFIDTNGISQTKSWRTQIQNEFGLTTLERNNLRDWAYLGMRIAPSNATLNVRYAFISEEYYRADRTATRYPNTDVFAFFVSKDNGVTWTNLARIVSQDCASVPVSIMSVNEKTNTHYFVSNVFCDASGTPTNPPPSTYDGSTIGNSDCTFPINLTCNGAIANITCSIPVTPGQEILAFAVIVDAENGNADSTLLLDEKGITSGADIQVDITNVNLSTNFILTVTNGGSVAATQIAVTNWFPLGFTPVIGALPMGVSHVGTGSNYLAFTVSSLPVGGYKTWAVAYGDFIGGDYESRLEAWPSEGDFNPVDNRGLATLHLAALPELRIYKSILESTLMGGQALRGSNLTYTIAVTNRGSGAMASTFNVWDLLPVGVTLPVIVGAQTNWSFPVLAAGQGWATNVTVTVDADAPDVLTNHCFTLNGLVEISTNCMVNVRPEADLSVTLIAFPPVTPGGRLFSYAVVVSNAGPCVARAITLSASNGVSGVTRIWQTDPGSFDLPVAASATFTLNATALDAVSGWVSNGVWVTSATVDPNAGNNMHVQGVFLDPLADVAVTASWRESSGSMAGNRPTELIVCVTNCGPAMAGDVWLSLDVAGTAGGDFSNTIDLGSLPALGVTNIILPVQAARISDVLHATATVTNWSTQIDLHSNNNRDTADLNVVWPDVAVQITADHASIGSGSNILFTVILTNQCTVATTGAVLTITVPSVFSTNGVPVTSVVFESLGILEAGVAQSWSFNVIAPIVTNVMYTITATVALPVDEGERILVNNTHAVSVTVAAPPVANVQPYLAWETSPITGQTSTVYRFCAAVTNQSLNGISTGVRMNLQLEHVAAVWSCEGDMPFAATNQIAVDVGTLLPGQGTNVWMNVLITNVVRSIAATNSIVAGNDLAASDDDTGSTLIINWPEVGVTLAGSPLNVLSGTIFSNQVTLVESRHVDAGEIAVTFITTNQVGTLIHTQTVITTTLLANSTTSWWVEVVAPIVPNGTTSLLYTTASILCPLGDDNMANDQAYAFTHVVAPTPSMADVAAFAQWGTATAFGDTNLDYSVFVAVSNVSTTVAATNVTVNLTLDSGTVDSLACFGPVLPDGYFSLDSRRAQLAVPFTSVPAGSGTGMWFTVRVSGVTNMIQAEVLVNAGNDTVSANNAISVLQNLLWPDLKVDVAALTNPLVEGRIGDFRVTVQNNADVPVTDIWLTNSYPYYLTLNTNLLVGTSIVDGTNFCVHGMTLAARSATNFVIRVTLPTVLPIGVSSTLQVFAACALPLGDTTPSDNTKMIEIPVVRNGSRGSIEWFLSANTGYYYARLVLTNVSDHAIDSLWFTLPDRMTATNNTILQAALWKTSISGERVQMPGTVITNQFADGVRYVDLTAAMTNKLGGAWMPGTELILGVSETTKARFRLLNSFGVYVGSSVNVPEERLIEVYERNSAQFISIPAQYVDPLEAIGTKSGTFTHESGLDMNGDFIIQEEELRFARRRWMDGTMADEDYLFLSAVKTARGYRWNTALQAWLIVE